MDKKIVAYFPEWKTDDEYMGYSAEDVPWKYISHLNYAFGRIKDGKFHPMNEKNFIKNMTKIKEYKSNFVGVKVLISVGGWGGSEGFSDISLYEKSRKEFAESFKEVIIEYDLDGIDIDWEFPVSGGPENETSRPEDKENFTLLLKSLREFLDNMENKTGKRYLLTIAAPANYSIIPNTEPDKYHTYIDFINLMTYDFHGIWDKYSNHHSPLYGNPNDPDPISREKLNCDFAVKEYLKLGVPSEKIILGIPFYGKGWILENNDNNGLFAKVKGIPYGIFDNDNPSGTNPFFFIKGVLENNPDYKKFRDNYAKAPWLWNPKENIMYSYDDEESISVKCEYVLKNNLGGVMFWEVTEDYPFKGDTLVKLIYTKLKGEET